jgi:hypothetical protein
MESDRITVSLYENWVPAFVGAELERLYQSIFSSLAHFREYGGIENTSTYVVRTGDAVTSLLLFRRERAMVRVMNEVARIGEEEIRRFVAYIFRACPSVRVIRFHSIENDACTMPFPSQRHTFAENIVLTLPATQQDYLASLGKSTRSYINRYLNKFTRTFPSFIHQVYQTDDVSEQLVRAIIALNRARMAGKETASLIDERETMRIVRRARSCGLVSVVTIDGRICAGLVNYRIGSSFFLEVIGHDPEYNDYRLGTLCCYLTICECIRRGGQEYHFLWGESDYKYRLRGHRRDLVDLTVYRSRRHLVLSGGTAARIALAGRFRMAKLWLQRQARPQSPSGMSSRLAGALLGVLRKLKRVGAPPAPV